MCEQRSGREPDQHGGMDGRAACHRPAIRGSGPERRQLDHVHLRRRLHGGNPNREGDGPSTLVAVYMNGGPLATAHGYPARIIVPGLYGMFHAKWVTKIETVQGEFLGYWQQKGWTNSGFQNGQEIGQINTVAIIATPPDNTVVGGAVTIGGVAL